MSLLETLILVVIAGIVGALAEFLIGFSLGGMLGAMIVGVLGALIGGWIARLLHLPAILPIQVGTGSIELVWRRLARSCWSACSAPCGCAAQAQADASIRDPSPFCNGMLANTAKCRGIDDAPRSSLCLPASNIWRHKRRPSNA